MDAKRNALLKAERQAVAAANARDAARLADLYAEDAVVILPNVPAMVGKPVIRTWLDRLAQNREVAFRYENLQTKTSRGNDFGYTLSRYSLTITRPDGSRYEESGRWVQIWKKAGQAEWKLAVEMATPDSKP